MEYYAASLREPGEKLNNDGLMIKGIHTKNNKDVVVMVLSSHKTKAKLNDRVIRIAEKMVYKEIDKDLAGALSGLFNKFCKDIFFLRKFGIGKGVPDLTILVVKGTEFLIMNKGSNRIVRACRLGVENLLQNTGEYICISGRLREGSTIIVGTKTFFSRLLDSDLHKRMCPQMCVNCKVMQENIESLKELLNSRGEGSSITAAAICVK